MLSVRELQASDIPLIADYWVNSPDQHLVRMGVDLAKVPPREAFVEALEHQLSMPIENRNAYCIIWELEGEPIGHCNTNPTQFGKEANMHLHIWSNENRRKNIGTEFLKMTIPLFFKNLKLNQLFCEPYALNDAPNRTLNKLGFTLIKEYTTVPGSINFEQPVKQWVMNKPQSPANTDAT
ncbi:MAG: GNAT family N-acetyltransferase [Flavobacteriales bacterium]